MRDVLCQTLVELAERPELVFLTGDLGYKALEPLRDALGERFINAGVAEQNMVSVAAGLYKAGFNPWVYSIAPFLYARPFEQIRNDVCLHDLPVKLIGNGGGYAYGVMGSTHHAIEDYGALLTLPHMHVFVPAFTNDVPTIIKQLYNSPHPAYLRLGLSEEPHGFSPPPYAPWRRVIGGEGVTMLVVGPLVGGIMAAVRDLPQAQRPALWVLTELPIGRIPGEFLADLRASGHLFVVEEHTAHGGVGQMIAHRLLEMGEAPRRFTSRSALGYVSGLYGSQQFHRAESHLDPVSIASQLAESSRAD